MKRIISVAVVTTLFALTMAAQTEKRQLEFGEDVDFSIRKGAFSFEPLSYFAFGDHTYINPDSDMDKFKGKANTEFFFNLLELRVHPYESGMFTLGIDLDWDYYRLDNSHFWMPDASKEKVTIASMENSGLKKIKKSRLSVRTISVPFAFEQSFGPFSLRLGVEGNYNSQGISRFKGVGNDDAKVNEWKEGSRFSGQIKSNTFTYGFFGAISYGGIGAYVKYSPMCQFADGFGPQFKSISFGVITGIGM